MLLASLLAACALAFGQSPKLLIELNDDELLRRAPELAGTRLDRDDALVKAVLLPAFESVRQSFDRFADLSAAETISELRLDDGGATARAQTEQFRYIATMTRRASGLRELRTSQSSTKEAKAGGGGFVVGDGLFAFMEMLLPEFENHLRIRPVGHQGGNTVFAFLQVPPVARDSKGVANVEAGSVPTQGFVWIDAKRQRPVRLRCVLIPNPEAAALNARSIDLRFAGVHFDALDATLLLPVRVVVDVRGGDVRTHAVHSFAGFRLYGHDEASDAALMKRNAGVYTPLPAERDALEQLGAGAVAVDANNAAGAVAPLREALRLDATLAPAHYHLARALQETGDTTGAEIEARAALSGMGDVAAAHNLLARLLMDRGAAEKAAAEMRETVRLAPGDANAHANLAGVLEASGDRAGALAELRRAVELAPTNEVLKARLSAMTAASPQRAANGNEPVIRVDVRQVLVPVLALDKSGHNVSDLKQSDFRVLENGVEQTITSFRVETSGPAVVETVPKLSAANEAEAKPAAPAPATVARLRHTYLLVVDSLHADFANLHYIREALRKFFASEPPGDSQYCLIALGESMTIIQNLTRDPAAVLASLDDKAFYKMYSGSRKVTGASTLSEFVRHLEDIRRKVDSNDPIAITEMKELPADADRFGYAERDGMKAFLSGLRSLVSQLSAGREHRTLVLMSEGFQLAPGHDAWEMLRAYFPELPKTSLGGLERMQSEFDSVVKVAARSNVVINTIDSRGLYAPSWVDASSPGTNPRVVPAVMAAMTSTQTEAGLTLGEFAAATGGTSYENSNDLLAGIRKAVADGRNYYTLGYVSTNAAMDGKFRNITVAVKGRKVTLKTKRGYWATE
jgi:VWFA-related protein